MVNKSEQQKINALFGDQNRQNNEIKVIETKPDLNCDVHSNRRRTSSGGGGGVSLYSSRKNLSLLALNEQHPTTATVPKKNTLTSRSTTNLNGGTNGYGLLVNHNNNGHNSVVYRKKKLATDLSPRTASIISSFGFDQEDRRQSYTEGDKARKRNSWNSSVYRPLEHPSAFPSLLRSTETLNTSQTNTNHNSMNHLKRATSVNRNGYESPSATYYSNSNKSPSTTIKPTATKTTSSPASILSRRAMSTSMSALNTTASINGHGKLTRSPLTANGNAGGVSSTSSTSNTLRRQKFGGSQNQMYLRTDSMGQLNLVKRDSLAGSTSRLNNGSLYGSRSRLNSVSSNRSSVPREVTMSTVPTTKMLNEKASILRKSPSIEYLNGELLTNSNNNLNTKLTKDNLKRHVRILEANDKDESDGGGLNNSRRKSNGSIATDTPLDNQSTASSRRISIDSLEVRKNSIDSQAGIPEEDMSNLSLNGDNDVSKIHGHNRNMTSSTSTCSPVHNYRKSENVRDYYNVPKNSQPMRQYTSRYNGRFSNGVSHVLAPSPLPPVNNSNNQCHKSYCNCSYNNPTMRRNNTLSRSMDELRSEYSYDIVSTPTNSINNNNYMTNNQNHNNNHNQNHNNNHNYSNLRKFSKPGYIPNNNRTSGGVSSKTRRLSQSSRPKQYSMDNLLTIENITFDENEEDYHHQNEAGRPHFVAVTSLEDVQAVRCAEFHPSGRIYAVGSNSKTFRICEYPTLADVREDHTTYQPTVLFKRTKHHKGSIYCMGWAPDGELVATGSNDKTIKLMRYNDVNKQLEGRETELTMHDGTVRDLCFLEDTTNKASLLISGGAGDCKIYVTDCATATPFQALSGHGGHILSLYNWGGAMFCSGSQDKTIRFWDLRTRGCVNTITPATNPGSRQGSPVAGVCVDPSGRLLVSGHEDSSCVLYDIRGNRPIQCFKPHSSDIRSIRFSPSAYYLLTSGYDNKLVLTDLQGDLTLPLPSVVVAQHTDKVISGRWHPTDFSFLSTSADKTATLWALPPS